MKYLLFALYFLSANQADYDGKDLTLSGQLQIEHPMGILKAEKATLKDLELHRPAKTHSQLFLEQGVSIEITQGKNSFTIDSKRAFCELPSYTLLSLLQCQELQFFDDVVIRMHQEITASGGSAIYKTGSLILYPAIPSNDCRLNRNQDWIDAHEIHFDLFKEELICSIAKGIFQSTKHGPLHFSSDKLHWLKKEEKLHLKGNVLIEQSNQFSVYADDAFLSFQNETEPDHFLLEGNVRLISSRIQDQESFSIADKIAFSPQDQKLILYSNSPNRVLFWQEGFSLSAPEIHIQRDRSSQQETIEGKGDVHFAFDMEEKNMIEQLISKYL